MATDYKLADGGKVFKKYTGKGASLVVPDGVETISMAAFYPAPPLRKIFLPSSLQKITKNALSRCESLEEIEVDEANSAFRSVD
jgi:hypothetical protein